MVTSKEKHNVNRIKPASEVEAKELDEEIFSDQRILILSLLFLVSDGRGSNGP